MKVFTSFLLPIFFIILASNLSLVYAHSIEGKVTIHMDENGFEPKNIKINKGDIVVFENRGKDLHWPASNIHPSHGIYPEFDPNKGIKPGQTWSFKFDKPGSWRFHDHLFPTLTGEIEVLGKADEIKGGENSFKSFLERVFYLIFPGKLQKSLDSFDILRNLEEKEIEIKKFIKFLGYKKVMDKLLKDSDGGSKVDCHQQAHLIGRLAYEVDGAKTFSLTDYSCHSGFIHGAMESFLSSTGTQNLAVDIEKLCGSFETAFSKFECLHGVGHGVLAYNDYNLPGAIKECQKLKTEYEQTSCFGGVFMENIVTAQGRGAKSGHKTDWVSSDPYFPCNAIDQNRAVQIQCYMMQTSRMLDIEGHNFDKISTLCSLAPENMKTICFQSMGRDAAGQTLRDPIKIRNICVKAPKEYQNNCFIGGLNVIVDFWGTGLKEQAKYFCNVLPDSNKQTCNQTLSVRMQEVFGN